MKKVVCKAPYRVALFKSIAPGIGLPSEPISQRVENIKHFRRGDEISDMSQFS